MGEAEKLSVDVERDDIEQSVTVHVGTGHATSGPTLYVYLTDNGTRMEWEITWHDAESGSDIEQGCGSGEVTQEAVST